MRCLIHPSLTLCMFLFSSLSAIGQPPVTPPEIVRFSLDGHRTCVAFSTDGKTLTTGGQDNHIRFWDVATHKQRLAIPAHNAASGVSRISYFPDGKTLVSGSWAGDGTVKLWEVATGKQIQLVGTNGGGISFAAVSPDGRYLAWSAGGKISVFDVKANREARSMEMRSAVDSVAFSPNSKLLATANGDGTVRMWEVETGKTVRDIRAKQTNVTGSQAVAFSRDGETIATASNQVRLWNVATGEELTALGSADEYAICVAISPDGRFLAGGTDRTLRVWDWATRKQIHSWQESIASVAFSQDGRWLAFGSSKVNGGAGLIDLGDSTK